MKAEEFLQQVSEKHEHRMASIPFGADLVLVLDAMEKYAEQKQNDIDELVEFIKQAMFKGYSDLIQSEELIQKHTKKQTT